MAAGLGAVPPQWTGRLQYLISIVSRDANKAVHGEA